MAGVAMVAPGRPIRLERAAAIGRREPSPGLEATLCNVVSCIIDPPGGSTSRRSITPHGGIADGTGTRRRLARTPTIQMTIVPGLGSDLAAGMSESAHQESGEV